MSTEYILIVDLAARGKASFPFALSIYSYASPSVKLIWRIGFKENKWILKDEWNCSPETLIQSFRDQLKTHYKRHSFAEFSRPDATLIVIHHT